jgi:hypothetical protein
MPTAIARPALTRLLLAATLAGGLVQPRAVTQVPAADPAAPLSLDLLFDRGRMLHDRNGDGVVDHVTASIVHADGAGPDELAAVADVAARVAFETSAIDLPLARSANEGTTIVVGAAGLQRIDGSFTLSHTTLGPGQGLVAAATVGGRGTVIVAGGDTAGTRAAATAFAGRLPHTADSGDATLADLARQVREFLSEAGVVVEGVSIPAVYVRSGSDDFERAVAAVRVRSTRDASAARAALDALARRKTAAPAPAGGARGEPPPLSYAGIETLRIRLMAPGARPIDVDVPRRTPRNAGTLPRRPGGSSKDSLDLSTLYTTDGLLGDSDNNLIPDRLDAMLSPGGGGAEEIAGLASRLGLESTGLSFPLARPASAIDKPEDEPPLVLVGASHPLVEGLVKENKVTLPTRPAEGLIQIVKRAFGGKTAVVVTGADAAGAARAARQVAERLPHIWARGKDRTTLEDVEEDVRRFLSGRSPAGQAATALYKLDQLAARLAGKDLESVSATVSVEKAAPGLERIVRDRLTQSLRAGSIDVAVENRDVQHARTIFTDEREIPSEVDDFWRLFRSRVVPAVEKNRPVVLEARLSEPPEIRAAIQQAARAELLQAGASERGTSVTVLSAYKQGFSWLYDSVRPALSGQSIEQLTIRFAEMGAPAGWSHQALFAPTRWLLEIFPVDELLARDLKIDLKQIRFEKMPVGSPAYEVIATGPGGAEILRQTFEPTWVLRPYLDGFPNYEQVRVTTGWIRAEVAGAVAADERIVTDPERFWDHYQANTLKAIYEHVMKVHEGKPRAQDAPFFGELTVDLTLSEPDYLVGVDKEQVMSLETVHEDIYFTTLSFFDLLGRYTRNANLEYPGRILPVMRPKADGKPGRVKITFTAFGAPRPGVAIAYRERGGRQEVMRLDIPTVDLDRPSALAAVVRDGQDGIERLDLRVKVDTERDERAELVKRAAERQVDARIISAEQVTALAEHLQRLRAAGLYLDSLSYHDLRELRITASWSHDIDPKASTVAALPPNGRPSPFPDIRLLLPPNYRHAGEPIVQWDTPIPPGEAYELLAKMATFPEATVYKAGESYLGKDIWAMDLMPAVNATHWSQAKATVFKPTVVYTARQHANEVSSTSHVLKLAELLLTDAEYRKKLQKVNVVVHPITNPDGAQLAYDLYKITPDYSLHAGYLGSLGADATSGGNDPNAIYPESQVRPKLWRTWLPDIFLNPHGYPHHMWIQPFSEFIGPVRNGRVTEERHWGIIRGWFMPGFSYLDDPRYPRHKDAVFQLRDKIHAYVKEASDMIAMNRRAYDRYLRYGVAWDNDSFKSEDFTHGALIYTAIKGARASQGGGPGGGGGGGGGDNYMTRYPNVTIWTGTTEAPDETAHGPWLKMVATAGLQWDKASLDFLYEGDHVIERTRESFVGGVSVSVHRPRPPRAPKKPVQTSDHDSKDHSR